MCVVRNRYGRECLADFTMGPNDAPLTTEEIKRRARGILDGMEPVDPEALKPFLDERRRQFVADPPRGLRRPESAPLSAGWQCPNCGRAHGPDVATCPESPRDGSLRKRIKSDRS